MQIEQTLWTSTWIVELVVKLIGININSIRGKKSDLINGFSLGSPTSCCVYSGNEN